MFFKLEAVLLVFCYNFHGLVTAKNSEIEGKVCGEGDSKGICTTITDCPFAQRSLKLFKAHGLERCGFEDFIEIVCCPSYPTLPTTNNSASVATRKSETACKEYSIEVPLDPIVQILLGGIAAVGEFPHMAALGYENPERTGISWECAGALISDRFILTAAHCIVKPDGILPVRIRLGVIDITSSDKDDRVDFDVKNITVHPQYQPRSKINDIALIALNGSISKNNNIHPACLYQKNDDPFLLVNTEWGDATPGGDPSFVLKKDVLHPVNMTECNKTYVSRISRTISSSQICAVFVDEINTCQGGGVLQVQQDGSSIYNIVGISSYGTGCGSKTPEIYTRVYSYLDWIESIV